jgi:hypothetical protein
MNSIFWENEANTGSDVYYTGTENMLVSYSDVDFSNIYGPYEGEGNIFEDPLFEYSDTAYFQLTEGSPCIDAGSPDTSGLNLPSWDIINNYRLWDGDGDMDTIVDMGAYEYGSTPIISGVEQFQIPDSEFQIIAYPNPTNGVSSFWFLVYPESASGRRRISGSIHVSLKIYDAHGREVATVLDQKLPEGEHLVQYNLSGLPEGMYVVRVCAGREVASSKIVKVR